MDSERPERGYKLSHRGQRQRRRSTWGLSRRTSALVAPAQPQSCGLLEPSPRRHVEGCDPDQRVASTLPHVWSGTLGNAMSRAVKHGCKEGVIFLCQWCHDRGNMILHDVFYLFHL